MDQVASLVEGLPHSAPGPDGVPYGAWRALGPAAHRALHALFMQGWLDGVLPDKFNYMRNIFIPKGELFEEELIVSAYVDKLRPLACSSTDAKVIALLLNRTLSALCTVAVSAPQRGFVSGRVISDNIIILETAMMKFYCTSARSAASILFDFANAFPSIAHQWIFCVPERLPVPPQALRLIKLLYSDCRAMLMFNGVPVGFIAILSGIKQGCPLSGSIFTLAVDPLIRCFLVASLVNRFAMTAYADDLAIVLADVFTDLPLLLRIFGRWSCASALKLNFTKCVLIPLWRYSLDDVRDWIRSAVPDFLGCLIAAAGKYLGVWMGPAAHSCQWSDIAPKLGARAAEIRLCDRGLASKLRIFHDLRRQHASVPAPVRRH